MVTGVTAEVSWGQYYDEKTTLTAQPTHRLTMVVE